MIEVREALRSGAESLRFHALRSFLAMLGIIFGVGAVIAMLSIGAGAEREALALIDAMGLRNVIVRAKDPERENDRQEMRRKSPGLDPRDVLAIKEAVPGVESVLSEVEVEAWKVLSATGRAKPEVRGVSHELPRLRPIALREGRFFDRSGEETYAPVCVIVTYDRVLDGSDDTPFDCGAVATALVNAAWSRGLGCVINSQGIMQSPVVREHAGIPDDQVIMKAVALGWPEDGFPANAVVSERKSVSEAARFVGFSD